MIVDGSGLVCHRSQFRLFLLAEWWNDVGTATDELHLSLACTSPFAPLIVLGRGAILISFNPMAETLTGDFERSTVLDLLPELFQRIPLGTGREAVRVGFHEVDRWSGDCADMVWELDEWG